MLFLLASLANNMLAERRIKSRSRETFKNITEEVEAKIIELLKLGSSPDVISKRLKMLDGTQVSKNTIYRFIKADRKNGLYRVSGWSLNSLIRKAKFVI